MNRRNDNCFKRILILVSAFMLMLLLCGCRTRITNNTEVTRTLEDRNGIISETYQERRDELGIPVADEPLFNRTSSDEESEDWSDYEDEEYGYGDENNERPDAEDEESEDEDENSPTTRPGNSPSQPGQSQQATRPATRPVSRPVSRPATTRPATRPASTTTTQTVKVTLNLNAKDAKCNRTSLIVRKGSTYGALPTPTRDGYTFKGWYTEKSKGKKVTSSTKVETDKAHTIYARWKETPVKTYTVTFDGNGDEDEVTLSNSEITVNEGGTYGKMPSAQREKYSFKGWFTDTEGGDQVTADTKFTADEDQTLYAQWEFEPYDWWKNEFDKSANEIDDESKIPCLIDGEKVEDSKKNFLKDCRCSLAEDEADAVYIVRFIDNYDEREAEAEELYTKYSENNPEVRVMIISDKALKAGKSKNQQLIYKMKTFDQLYGSALDMYEAESDMLDGDEEIPYPYIYPEE